MDCIVHHSVINKDTDHHPIHRMTQYNKYEIELNEIKIIYDGKVADGYSMPIQLSTQLFNESERAKNEKQY